MPILFFENNFILFSIKNKICYNKSTQIDPYEKYLRILFKVANKD